MTFSHDDIDQRIVDLLYGELAGEERAAFDAHVAGCERCRREVESLTGARAAARTVVRAGLDDEVPSPLRERILVAARQAAAERPPVKAPAAKSAPAARAVPKWLAWLRGPWSLPTLATVTAMAGFLLVRGTIFREARRPLGEAPEARLTRETETAPAQANRAEPARLAPDRAESPKADGRPAPEAKSEPAGMKRKAAPVAAAADRLREVGSSKTGARRHAAASKPPAEAAAEAEKEAPRVPAKRDVDDFLDQIDPPRIAERRAVDAPGSAKGTGSGVGLGGLGTRGQAGGASKDGKASTDDLLEGALSKRPAPSPEARAAVAAKPEAPADKPLSKVAVSVKSSRRPIVDSPAPVAGSPAPATISQSESADLDTRNAKANRGRGFAQPPPPAPAAPRAAAPARASAPTPPPAAAAAPLPRDKARATDEETELSSAEEARAEPTASRAKKQKATEKAPISDDVPESERAAVPSGADAVRALADRAQRMFDAHRWDEAVAAYRELLRRFPRDTAADAWRKRLAAAQSAAATEKSGFAAPPSR